MKIVCDTNVLVRAAINPNGLAADLLANISTSHVLVASYPLLVLTTRDQHFFDAAVFAYAAGHGVRIIRDDQLLQELRSAQP